MGFATDQATCEDVGEFLQRPGIAANCSVFRADEWQGLDCFGHQRRGGSGSRSALGVHAKGNAGQPLSSHCPS